MSENFKPSNIFEIKNSKEFYEKLCAEFDDFDREHLNPRYAINAALTSWHLTDWTYQEFFKSDSRFQDSKENAKNISGLVKYQEYIKTQCSELEFMRQISNGSKHCKVNQDSRTEISQGDYSPYDYDRHDYDVPRFVILHDQTNEEIDFENLLVVTIKFWKEFLETR